jgi:O-antigen ligase
MTVLEHSSIETRPSRTSMPAERLYSPLYLISFCAVLMFGVLAFGAAAIWANSILEIGAALLFTVLVVHKICISGLRAKWNPLYAPAIGFAAVGAAQVAFNLTAYRYATLLVCLQYLSYAALLFVATQLAGDLGSSKNLVLGFTVFGSAVALLAICQYLSSAPKIYWLHWPGTGTDFFGTYVNRDHYAGLMEMLTPFALVLSLSRLIHGGQRMLAGFAAIIMAGSIVLTLSRGGVISLVAELLFLFWITSRVQRESLVRNRLLLGLGLTLAFLAFAGSSTKWTHLGDVRETFRWDVLKDSLRMFAHKPILGWGLGTFDIVYPAYRSFYTTLYVNAAHNDYLQVLIETGILGFSCVLWFGSVLYRTGLKGLRHWNQSWRGALQLSALVGCTGLLVHSALDFNLQVPGNAAFFYAFCALATSLRSNAERLT